VAGVLEPFFCGNKNLRRGQLDERIRKLANRLGLVPRQAKPPPENDPIVTCPGNLAQNAQDF